MQIIEETRSVCPICLKNIPAHIVRNNEEIQIVKQCKEHGEFSAPIWRGMPEYTTWKNINSPLQKQVKQRVHSHLDCPTTCGLCQNHSQKTCTVLLELCEECNLHCPVCFASSKTVGTQNFIPLEKTIEKINFLHKKVSSAILQLSGGEPTLYPHLLDVIKYASPLFSAIQLNTNGILLAENENFAKELKNAGLSWVFLQFDGTNDEIHKQIRGKALQSIKEKAIENCTKANLGVMLVSTLVEGINDNNIGELLDFALARFPHVRGIHFQPMTFSGRNSLTKNRKHITLPEVLQKISNQSKGCVQIEHASPSSCEHSLCSFNCRYYVKDNNELEYIPKASNDCGCEPIEKDDAPTRSIETTIKYWQNVEDIESKTQKTLEKYNLNAFDDFIKKARAKTFSISCMAFQDVSTIDLERLQNCCIHIYDGKEALIPFCAYNLTSIEGKALYR